MTEEFNLSDKVVQGKINVGEVKTYIMTEEVKEFIRLLKKNIITNVPDQWKLDKLAGEKLI